MMDKKICVRIVCWLLIIILLCSTVFYENLIMVASASTKNNMIVNPSDKIHQSIFVADSLILGEVCEQYNYKLEKEYIHNSNGIYSRAFLENYTYKYLCDAVVEDTGLVTLSAFWNRLDQSLNGEFLTNKRYRELIYEAILMDYLAYSDNTQGYKSHFLQTSTKYSFDLYSKMVDITAKDYQEQLRDIIDNQTIAEAEKFASQYGYIKKLNKYFGLMNNINQFSTSVWDYYENLSKALALEEVNECKVNYLKSIKAVSRDNPELCNAVDDILSKMEACYAKICFDEGWDVISKNLIKLTWKSILDGLKKGTIKETFSVIELGTAGLDWMFNSNDRAENTLRLLTLSIIDNKVRNAKDKIKDDYEVNRSEETATNLINGFSCYIDFQRYATNFADKYCTAVLYSGMWNTIKNYFTDINHLTYNKFKQYFQKDKTSLNNLILERDDYYNDYNYIFGLPHTKFKTLHKVKVDVDDTFWYVDENCNSVTEFEYIENNDEKLENIAPCFYFVAKSKSEVSLNSCRVDIKVRNEDGSLAKPKNSANIKKLTISLPEKVSYKGNEFIVTEISGKPVISEGVVISEGFDVKIREIQIPDSVTQIGVNAFSNSVLEKIELPNTVISIGFHAFSNCDKLKEVTIPNSVTSIGREAFHYCKNLKSVSLSDSVNDFGGGIFTGCKKLENVTIPNGIKKIPIHTFAFCESLEEIIIPKSVTEIGCGAFLWCKNLKKIMIPKTVNKIGYLAFGYQDTDEKVKDFTIYGYENTVAQIYAEENGFEFVSSNNNVTKDEELLIDINTGVTVVGKFDDNVSLRVTERTITINNAIKEFDISLLEDSEIIQPNSEIKISIPNSEKNCRVFWIKDDGTKIDMNAEYIDGKYIYTTNHLSVYALIKNSDYENVVKIIFIVFIVLISLIFICKKKIKSQNY